ncbi:hypothetical protein [Nonomuraea diastatica]|uniref:Uncharacterized protein n=1 Tax=Nonomuraea diastatica TaxID=1848329 RepID=A0A4R4W3M5_9ACTN|nr:hypothetical protein [Nonomuraea diastatica]TDD09595.1 hypothetical protein E1294_46680 [Nonomuraea diastatica]
MLDEAVARYSDILDYLGEDMAYTVTLPNSGELTIEEAVRRMGFDPIEIEGPGTVPHSGHSIRLYQVGVGVVTLDGVYPTPERKQVTDQLGGDGFRHWYVAFDINGNASMYADYGGGQGKLEYPEPINLPFTPWTELLGPLRPYAELLARAYDSEEAEATVNFVAACLAVTELESGIRLEPELLHTPYSALPLPSPNFD